MDFKKYATTWMGIHASNQFMKTIIMFLLISNLLMMIGLLKKDATTILIPPDLSERAEITRNQASSGYKKAWAVYVAEMIGNVSPENADFVRETFSEMLSGEIRNSVMEQIAEELEGLKQEGVNSVFEIKSIAYEPETDKVFVTGQNRMSGPGGTSEYTPQTFEFVIEVKGYAPIIKRMSTYSESPRTQDKITREEEQQKAIDDAAKKDGTTN
ncbi:TraE/TraK family type IV conjugative transfer system protein [Methylomonas sp. AM2-LC]|uniref:TraE/TraK family type IV conjugative transfer system protein n=1 Tax=Methylomonas sp. AM2-LC TaxID=3153301 RepID=UPI003264A334